MNAATGLSSEEKIAQARAYVATIPGAVSGQEGHSTTFGVVCNTVEGFDLSEDEAEKALEDWNKQCDPPWSDKEFKHKIEDALAKVDEAKRGSKLRDPIGDWATLRAFRRDAVAGMGGFPTRDCVAFPMFLNGENVGISLRHADGGLFRTGKKSHTPKGNRLGLFLSDAARRGIPAEADVFICEGSPNAVALVHAGAQFVIGFPFAPGSEVLFSEMARLLECHGGRVFVCPDAGGAGLALAGRVIRTLHDFGIKQFVILHDHDADLDKRLIDGGDPARVLADLMAGAIGGREFAQVGVAEEKPPEGKTGSEEAEAAQSPNAESIPQADPAQKPEAEPTPEADAGLSVHTPTEILNLILPDDDNIVGDRAIVTDDLTVIAGPAGLGKTRAVMQLAIDAAFGRPWLGVLPIHRRDIRYLVLQTENGARRLKQELSAQLCNATPSVRQWLDEHLFILVPLKPDDRDMSLDNPVAQERIMAAVRRFKPDIVIADPYIDFFAGDNENDAQQTRETLRRLMQCAKADSERTGEIIIHHSRMGRAAAAGAVGWDSGAYARGSKALVGVARSQINLAPGDPNDSDLIVVSHAKCNNGRRFLPFAVRLDVERMTYVPEPDFDLAAWEESLASTKRAKSEKRPITDDAILPFIPTDGEVAMAELAKHVCAAHGYGRTKVYDYIAALTERKVIEARVDGRQKFVRRTIRESSAGPSASARSLVERGRTDKAPPTASNNKIEQPVLFRTGCLEAGQ